MSNREGSGNSLRVPKKGKKVIRLLTNELRKELKKPQGLLIVGPFEKTMKKLKKFIEEESPSLIVSVGDIVSRNMIKYDVSPNVVIVDNKVMRKPIHPITVDADQTFYAKNPPGTITDEAWVTIKNAIDQKGKTRVIIEGEEDLLTIAVVLSAPKDTLVVYGQPKSGIVVVMVEEETKERMEGIVNNMKQSSKS